jgi:hypothetical protein
VTNRELLAAVREWSAFHYPGCPLEYITIHLRFLPVPVQQAEGPALVPGVAQEASGGEKAPRCTAARGTSCAHNFNWATCCAAQACHVLRR